MMRTLWRSARALLVSAAVAVGLTGCASAPPPNPGPLLTVALGVGASVGTYFLIQELD